MYENFFTYSVILDQFTIEYFQQLKLEIIFSK